MPQKTNLGGNKELFSLRFIPSRSAKEEQVFFIVSKKVAKKATERNLLKRRYKHALRDVAANLPKRKNITFYIKQGSLKATFLQIKAALKQSLASIK